MRRVCHLFLVATLAIATAKGAPADLGAPGASIMRVRLGTEDTQSRPFTIPTAPEDTLEIDFPWPVEDWAGRGFTPDPEKYAGDFVVEAKRGTPRIFITAVVDKAHRVLHVVLTRPDGIAQSIPIELIPAQQGDAWHTVVFYNEDGKMPAGRKVSLEPRPPKTRLREASPESELALIRTMRLMLNSTDEDAQSVVSANPALALSLAEGTPRSFGAFTLSVKFALRDSTTGSLGLCASVTNGTMKRLLFDPSSWVVRVGDHVYPVRTADFPGELEPGATAPAFLILAGDTGIMPDNLFEVSLRLVAEANPRPVHRVSLDVPQL